MISRFVGLVVLLFAALGVAHAQDDVVFSPQAIVVNPSASFSVDVFVDRQAQDNTYPVYQVGENIRIGVSVTEDAYVYLFNVRPNGEVVQILPNELDESGRNNFIRGGQTRYFPPEDARYTFSLRPPTGLDKVIAVASREALDPSQLRGFTQEGDFRVSTQGETEFAQTLSIVVQPLPQENWVTDTAIFYVLQPGQAAPQAIYGTLDIQSQPQAARVYVDDQFVGHTPVRYGTRQGEHTIRIERSGYETFQTQVTLQGGETRQISTNLTQQVTRGSLLVQGNVGGATVFLEGRQVGTLANVTGELTVNELDPGSYRLRITAPGFNTVERTVQIQAGQRTNVSVNLTQEIRRGSILVQGNIGGAAVFLDGRQVGSLANVTGELTIPDLEPGSYRLRVTAPGFSTVERTVQVQPGERTRISINQERQQGTVRFNSQPEGAEVFVGGQRVGTTPTGNVNLQPGTYEARFSRSGYSDATVRFVVQANTQQTVSASLERQAQDLMERLNLASYPNAEILRLEQNAGQFRLEFQIRAELQNVYDHFHAQLRREGWERTNLNVQDNSGRIDAQYVRSNNRLELQINQQGNSGRFRVEGRLQNR